MQNNIIDRLFLFMSDKSINDNQMTVCAGLSIGVIGKMRKGITKGLNSSNIEKILHAYPDLSSEWLLRGEGEMYKSKTSNEQSEWNVLLKEINDRDEIIRKQAEQIGALKAELSLKAKTASPAHDLQAAAAV